MLIRQISLLYTFQFTYNNILFILLHIFLKIFMSSKIWSRNVYRRTAWFWKNRPNSKKIL